MSFGGPRLFKYRDHIMEWRSGRLLSECANAQYIFGVSEASHWHAVQICDNLSRMAVYQLAYSDFSFIMCTNCKYYLGPPAVDRHR